MSKHSRGGKFYRVLLCMIAGGLCGAGIALLYAPSSGDKTRHYLRMKTEWARRRTGSMTEGIRETMDRLVAEMKEITGRLREEGTELTRETKADILSSIEAGTRAMDEEKKRLARNHTRQREHDYSRHAG